MYRIAIPDANTRLKGLGKVFQRLDDLADLIARDLSRDVRAAMGKSWPQLNETWAAHHVFTHCDGIVDAKYLAAAPGSALRIGQRLRIDESFARAAIKQAEALSRAVAGEA